MKASFDGARRNLVRSYNAVAIRLNGDRADNRAVRLLMDELRSDVGGLLLMHDPDDADDCNELNIELVEVIYRG